jgi:hypothetical protein
MANQINSGCNGVHLKIGCSSVGTKEQHSDFKAEKSQELAAPLNVPTRYLCTCVSI